MPPERIYDALTTGPMKPQGDQLTDDQRKMLATFLSGRPLGSLKEGDAKDMPNHCASNPPLADPGLGLGMERLEPGSSPTRASRPRKAPASPPPTCRS